MDVEIYYSGEQARNLYGPIAPVISRAFERAASVGIPHGWNPETNTLKIVMVTAKDLDPSEEFKGMKWSGFGKCQQSVTPETVRAEAYLGKQLSSLYRLVAEASRGSNGESEFSGFVQENPFLVSSRLQDISINIFKGDFAVTSLSRGQAHVRSPLIVMSLSGNPLTVAQDVDDFSAIGINYFRNFGSSDFAHQIFSVVHEAAHGYLAHGGNNPSACYAIDYRAADRGNYQEGMADAIAALGVEAAQELSLITAKDARATNAEIEATRAVGNYMYAQNSFALSTTRDLNGHVTTFQFSAAQSGVPQQFKDMALFSGVSALPSMINSMADTIAGFSKFGSEPQKKPLDPGYHASLGKVLRLGNEAENALPKTPQKPEYFVAAMIYLKKTGGLDELRSRLTPSLQIAFDDLVNDFFAAIYRYGSELLVNPSVLAQIEKTFPATPDYKGMVDEMIRKGTAALPTSSAIDPPIPKYILK